MAHFVGQITLLKMNLEFGNQIEFYKSAVH